MKTLTVAALVFALLVVPIAEAKTCAGLACNYIDTNPGFSSDCTYWDCPGPTYYPSFPNSTTCSNSTKVCQLGNYAVIKRHFEVDDTYENTYGIGITAFKLKFDLNLPNDSNNFYDELTVTVRNDDTGDEETTVYRGTNVGSCQTIDLVLYDDYSEANVTVTFRAGGLLLHPWQIDNVSFWAYF